MTDLPTTPTSPNGPSSTASSSLYRRHGLSPRQRRLLQAAARARAQNNTSENPSLRRRAGQTNADEPTSLAGSPVSPSSQLGTPISPTTSPSSILSGAPPMQNGPKSNTIPNSHNKSLSSSLDKFQPQKKNDTSGCSGASTVTTDATTASIGSGFRRLRLSPVRDVHEGEVAEAMRGKVSDRVKRFNNIHAGDTINCEKAKNHRVVGCRQLKEEHDENDTTDDDGIPARGPLNHQVEKNEQLSLSKNPNQKQINSLPSEISRHSWKNGILKTAAKQMELRYYRVVYPGVVSLLSEWNTEQEKPDTSQLKSAATPIQTIAETNTESGNNKTNESTSGVYLGYGEVVATSSPEITIPIAELETQDNCETVNSTEKLDSEKKCIRAIRVESILTGGYTIAHDNECLASDPSVPASRKSNTTRHYGFLLLGDRFGRTIAEYITPSKPGSVGPSYESGPFVYRVRATSPVRVLSGPHFHAPSMRFALLPGTVHDVSFRVSLPVSDSISDNEAADILVDDADAGEVKFLRLSHRRGWVADRRVEDVDGDSKRLRVSYLMQNVTDDPGIANISMSNSHDCSSLSSSLHSKSNSSFYRSLTASSVATPPAVNAQRKRTNRRRREAFTVPIMLQESRQAVGESFDTESSVTGYGGGTIVSSGGDSIVDSKSANSIETFYLMRVLAPLGLKILDAPHFQVCLWSSNTAILVCINLMSNLLHSLSCTIVGFKLDPHSFS